MKKFTYTPSSPPQTSESEDSYFPPWFNGFKKWLKIVVLSFTLICVGVALYIWNNYQLPLTSPITSLTTFHFLSDDSIPNHTQKIVYGFLPYWNIDDVQVQPELTQLSYFGLTIGSNGKIITREKSYAEPGYNKLGSDELLEVMNQVKENDSQIEITLISFNPDTTTAFLLSDTAHQNLIDDLDSLLLAYPISGINIDIEIVTSDKQVRDKLSLFTKTLREHLNDKYDKINLSISLFPSASNNKQIWDLEALNQHVDHFVVMAYDFHRTSSLLAGPVAPLFGGKDVWDTDVTYHLEEFLKIIPPEKILLGLPFYGYEWQTTDREAQANTFPESGRTASIRRVQELLADEENTTVQQHWNEEALSPYLSYIDDGEIYVIYYEDSRSISYKLDLVNQLDLAGIAIWALGYEGDSRELWEVVQDKIRADLQ